METEESKRQNRKPWKTALLMFGSAMLGASAVALWNRSALARIQEQASALDAGKYASPEGGEGGGGARRMDEEIF